MSPKQVTAARHKARTFFDRIVRIEGYTRTLSLGKILPKGWRYVRISVKSRTDDEILISVIKLLGDENHAQTPPTDTQHK